MIKQWIKQRMRSVRCNLRATDVFIYASNVKEKNNKHTREEQRTRVSRQLKTRGTLSFLRLTG